MKKHSSPLLVQISRFFTREFSTAFAFAILASFALIKPAFALAPTAPTTATTIGDVLCNLQNNGMGNMPTLFSAIAYIAGCFFLGTGLYEMLRHHDNPRERPIHHPVMRLCGGTALMSSPYVVSMLIQTFYETPADGGVQACTGGAAPTAVTSGSTAGLDVLITNLVKNIKDPMAFALSALAVLIGLFFIVRGLLRASKFNSDPRSHSMTVILSNLCFGTLLVVVGQSMDMVLGTAFGIDQGGMEDSSVVANWSFVTQLNAGTPFVTAVGAALNFFQLVGLIAFIRGWMILKNATEGSGQATMAQGITHILGGAMALNIFNMLEIFDKTFGTALL